MNKFIMMVIGISLILEGCDNCPTAKLSKTWIIEGKTMGTCYRVVVVEPSTAALTDLKEAIQQQLIQDDHQFSIWQPDTIISRFNQYYGVDPQPISPGIADVISISLRIGAKTGGAMDITIGPLTNLWGFGPDKQPITIPDIQHITEARQRVGLKNLRLIETDKGQWLQKDIPNLYIDLSTVGEGYATDHLAALLEKRGIIRYLVSVGGTVLTRGLSTQQHPWRVAIQQPTDAQIIVNAIVNLQGYGISTSGSYRNYYDIDGKHISHIIDPATGCPIEHKLVSATVIATTALEADGWDTGLMVLGTEKAKKLALHEGLAVLLITKTDNGFSSWMSPQFSSFLVKR